MRLFEKAANDLILVSISVALPQLKADLAWLFEQDMPAITLRFQQEAARFNVPLRCRSSLARLLFLPLPDVRICPGYRTMKTPDSAIRALRFEADEKARRVADLEQMIREFEQVAADLERQIKAEEDRTGVRDTSHFAYSTFARSAAQRRENLLASADGLRGRLDAAIRERDEATEHMTRASASEPRTSNGRVRGRQERPHPLR